MSIVNIFESSLPSSLTLKERHVCFMLAANDAYHWLYEARNFNLPDVDTMHLDWVIPDFAKQKGVTPKMMQELSFNIATVIVVN